MQTCLDKADEALKAAQVCYDNGLYNSCASRCYYAMFWAAIAGLEWAGFPTQKWSHGGLASTFGREFVKKRGAVRSKLAARLKDCYLVRRLADYERKPISAKTARRVLAHCHEFVTEVKEVIQ